MLFLGYQITQTLFLYYQIQDLTGGTGEPKSQESENAFIW